jgi:hypothetical protein
MSNVQNRATEGVPSAWLPDRKSASYLHVAAPGHAPGLRRRGQAAWRPLLPAPSMATAALDYLAMLAGRHGWARMETGTCRERRA